MDITFPRLDVWLSLTFSQQIYITDDSFLSSKTINLNSESLIRLAVQLTTLDFKVCKFSPFLIRVIAKQGMRLGL